MFSGGMPSGGSTVRSNSSSQISQGVNALAATNGIDGGLFRSRSVSNARQHNIGHKLMDIAVADSADGGSGLAARFNLLNNRGFDSLDTLFGRGWSLDGSTGIISVSDASFLRITNTDPIEKWYTIDPEPIARGQFAVVYRCLHRVTGVVYAAKFSARHRLGHDATRDIKHEAAVGAVLTGCHRTVRLHDVFATAAHIILVMEYAPGGDLQTMLDEDLVPFEQDVIGFLRQLLLGLLSVHNLGIVHLDIKPQNLVLMGDFPECAVKLCDFEISRWMSPHHEVREILGTPDYVAPEIIHYEPITTKTDMWSLGVLTYVLLTGFLPFGGDTDQETFLEISEGHIDFPKELFGDVSSTAINFIKRLMVRTPRDRMSVIECLEHPWLKTDYATQPKTSPSLPLQAPQQSKSTTLPNTPTANWNILDDWASLSSNYKTSNSIAIPNKNMTPTIMSPACMTPTLGSSPRDPSHFPPQRPYYSYRPSTSAHSSTHSLYRGSSRQNLDRLRSQSKSREVLVERLQLSSQRKTVSRSRERLFDAQYALTRSREHLLNNKSFSHSVEELPPYDILNNDNEVCSSMNNVYMLPIYPSNCEDSFSSKLYKSLASVEKIDEVLSENNNNSEIFPSSRQPVNSMTDDQYSTYLSRFYPDVGSRTQEPQRQLERTTFQGGRNSQPCEKHCTRHNRLPYTLEPPINKRSQQTNTSKRNENQRKQKENELVKRDKKKQQKEKPKPKINNIEKNERKTNTTLKPTNSTVKPRKGSVSHIEQRIQERHERMQEKNEKLKKMDKIQKQRSNSVREKPRRHSTESEKPRSTEKLKHDKKNSTLTTRRNSFPARKHPNLIKKVSDSQTTSPSISLESVKEINIMKNVPPGTKDKNENRETNKRRERPKTLQLVARTSDSIESKTSESSDSKMSESLTSDELGSRNELDEAYVSLEEPVDDGIFSRSESMDSDTTICSNSTLHAKANSSETLDTTFQDLLITENNDNTKDQKPKIETTNLEFLEPLTLEGIKHSEKLAKNMTIIQEVDSDFKEKIFTRSISTSSDIGSMLSEESDLASEEYHRKLSNTKESSPDYNMDCYKNRNRSNSVQNQPNIPAMPFKLSRSNSVHLDSPLSGVARPWGEVCHGSVFRALTMFRQQSSDSNSSGSSTSSRRRSSNWSTAEGLDQIIEKIRTDENESHDDITVAPLFKISDFSQPISSQIPNPPPLPSKHNMTLDRLEKNVDSSSHLNTSMVPSSPTLSLSSSSLPTYSTPSLTICQQLSNNSENLSKSKLPVRLSNIPIRTRF